MNNQQLYIGIIRETNNDWERRTPLVPSCIQQIKIRYPQLNFIVQPSNKRIFQNKQYQSVGTEISDDLSKCQLILCIQKPAIQNLLPNKTYLCFSHTHKAQEANMQFLDACLQKHIRLLDIEKITDERNKRLLSFGRFGGIAGCIDFLAGLGQYILKQGSSTPLLNVGYAYKYFDIFDAFAHIQMVGQEIIHKKIPQDLCPLIFAVTGDGRCANGVWEVLDQLKIQNVQPDELEKLCADSKNPVHRTTIYVTSIQAEHMVEFKKGEIFNKKHYYQYPELYKPIFHKKYLPYISVIFNSIYWEQKFPRLIENSQIRELVLQNRSRLIGVCDISCDMEGSIEFLKKYTNPDKPQYIYDPINDQVIDEVEYKPGHILYQAFHSYPCEIPRDSSLHCSQILQQFLYAIVESDINKPPFQQNLPGPIERSMITWNGQLTPDYQYIEKLRSMNATLGKKKNYSKKRLINTYMAMKIKGQLFQNDAINQIYDCLAKSNIQFSVSDIHISNSNNDISSVLLQIVSSQADKLKNVIEEVHRLANINKLQIEDVLLNQEIDNYLSKFNAKL